MTILCDVLGVTRQGYYDWIKRSPSKLSLRHQYLKQEIERVYYEHGGRYGSPRIALQLYYEGIETNKRVVARLMRELGLIAVGYHRKRKNKRKNQSIEDVIKENILSREFNQDEIDAVWVTDITYVKCKDGLLYLSTYIDLTTRIPRCFKIDTNMKKHLVLDPLEKYVGKYPKIIHSDRGSQYRSYAYRELLESNHIQHSMSEPGTPVDNAVIESYHKTIKRELIYPNSYRTKAEMVVLIQNYLNVYYTHKRIHTKFMMTPKRHEELLSLNLM